MQNTIEFYQNGQKVATFENVESLTTFSDGSFKVRYRESKKVKTVQSNLHYIYYDVEK